MEFKVTILGISSMVSWVCHVGLFPCGLPVGLFPCGLPMSPSAVVVFFSQLGVLATASRVPHQAGKHPTLWTLMWLAEHQQCSCAFGHCWHHGRPWGGQEACLIIQETRYPWRFPETPCTRSIYQHFTCKLTQFCREVARDHPLSTGRNIAGDGRPTDTWPGVRYQNMWYGLT